MTNEWPSDLSDLLQMTLDWEVWPWTSTFCYVQMTLDWEIWPWTTTFCYLPADSGKPLKVENLFDPWVTLSGDQVREEAVECRADPMVRGGITDVKHGLLHTVTQVSGLDNDSVGTRQM